MKRLVPRAGDRGQPISGVFGARKFNTGHIPINTVISRGNAN